MDYLEFIQFLKAIRPEVLRFILAAEAELKAGTAPRLMAPRGPWSFSDRVWRSLYQNTAKMIGVKRITGSPYATHPTRMAVCLWTLLEGSPYRERSTVLALFHDYLEEGDGRTAAGVNLFQREFPLAPDGLLGSVLLSEPEIDYAGFAVKEKDIEDVAYVVQVLGTLERLGDQSYANACLADKIDNLHHLAYITKNRRYNSQRKFRRLRDKLGYFKMVSTLVGPYADPQLAALLAEGIVAQARRHKIGPTEVARAERELLDILHEHRQPLECLIADYQRRVGVSP